MTELLNNIKNLRETTGVGFLDCKKALVENNNDIQKSIDYLRKIGLAKASKKISREAKEGAVGVLITYKKALLIEINTETDFAAKNESFLNFFTNIADLAINLDSNKEVDLNNFLNSKFENKKVSDYFNEIISKIGENIILRRINLFDQNERTKFFSYTHNSYKPNVGKICVVLKTEIDFIDEKLKKVKFKEAAELGKNITMHIAASKPLSIDIESLDQKLIIKEKEIQLANIKSSGKDENIINKILEGKMKKFYSEVTLHNQKYILDDKKTIKQVIDEFNSEKGLFKIIDFCTYILGS